VHYTAAVTNNGSGSAATGGCTGTGCFVEIVLPSGFSHRTGTTSINGAAAPNPVVSGQSVRFPAASLPPSIASGGTLTIEFDADVAAGTPAGLYGANLSSWLRNPLGQDIENSIAAVAPVAVLTARSEAPLLASPIPPSATTVIGTTTEIQGSTIRVSVNGNPAGSTTSASGGAFSVTVPQLFAGQQVTATAQATGELESPQSPPVTVHVGDTTPPTGSILIQGGKAWTRTTAVTLTLSCTDPAPGSGCAQIQFSHDSVTFTDLESYADSKAWTLPAGDGTKTVYVRFQDIAGNVSGTFSDGIKLDTTKPVVSGVSDTPDPFQHHLGGVSTMFFTVSDKLAVKCKMQVKIFNASNVLVRTLVKTGVNCPVGGAAGSITWDGRNTGGTLVPVGLYTYKVQAIDKALNRSVMRSGTVNVQ
jgi:hypothetical protein